MNVADIIALGNKVKITHLRRPMPNFQDNIMSVAFDAYYDDNLYTRKQLKARYQDSAVPSNLGGMTIISLETPCGQVLKGQARCSDKDNFCKKLGIQIALGRAITSGE